MHSVVPTKGVKFKYVIGEKVLCYEPDPAKAKVLYESKVLDLVTGQEGNGRKRPEYLVHFSGWSNSWDRCVREDWVLPMTDENRELQRRLAEEATIYLKGRRIPPLFKDTLASNKANEKPKPEIVSEPDSSESSEDETENEVIIKIPDSLKSQLEEDFRCITKKNKLVAIPCYPNVVAILEGFVKHSAAKMFCESPPRNGKQLMPEDVQDKLCLYKEAVDGLRVSFNFTLPHLLLYGQEKKQHYSHCSTARPHRDHHEEIAPTSMKVEPPSSDPECPSWEQPSIVLIKQEPPESPPRRGRPRLHKNKKIPDPTPIYNSVLQTTDICSPVDQTMSAFGPVAQSTSVFSPVAHTTANCNNTAVHTTANCDPVVEANSSPVLRKEIRNRNSHPPVVNATTSRNRGGKSVAAKKHSTASGRANLKEQMIQKRKKGRPKSLPTRVLRSSHIPVRGSRLPTEKKPAGCRKTSPKKRRAKTCPLPIVIKTEPVSPGEERVTRRSSVQARLTIDHTAVNNTFGATPPEHFSNHLTNNLETSSFEDRITRSVQSRLAMENLVVVPLLQASTPFRPPAIADFSSPPPSRVGGSSGCSSRGRGGIGRLTDLLRDARGWRMLPECHWDVVPAEPSLIYGAQHLLRLFVKLPDLISKMRIPNQKLQPLLDILHQFLAYMLEQKGQLFPPSAYVDCPSDK